jgi:hypothetical protein
MTTTAPTRPSGDSDTVFAGSLGTSAHAADIARGVASTTLASFVDNLVDVGQGAICAEHRFDRLRLDGLMSTRAVNNDSVRVPEHRYAAR